MSTEDKEGKARNEEIENQLKRDKMLQKNEIKVLLLGKRLRGYLVKNFYKLLMHMYHLNRCWRVG